MTYLLILIAYAVLMIAVGAWVSRKVSGAGDLFVAGRGLSTGLLFSTLLAANIGAGSTVGATGLGFRDGMSAWWWVGSAGIGSLILAFTVGPRIWLVARDHNLYTVGDYLEFRFSRAVRTVAAVLLWFGTLSILAGQLIAIAWILNVTAGLSKPVGCLIGAAVATIYFTAGGLFGTARVNASQLIVKLVGFGLAIAFLWNAGRIGESFYMIRVMETVQDPVAFTSFVGIGGPGIWKFMVLLVPSFIVSPGLLQKIFGARDAGAVRRGVAFNAIALLVFALVPALLGVIAHAEFPDLANRELALPTLLTNSMPVWLGGLLLGAIFAAEVSTADAVLFMLSTSLSRDLYQTWINPQADDRALMRVVRVTAIACGLIGALLGILFETVISALTIFYTLLSAALLLPILAGLYTRRVGARACLVAMCVSVGVTFLLDRLSSGAGYYTIPSLIWGTLSGLAAMVVVQQHRER